MSDVAPITAPAARRRWLAKAGAVVSLAACPFRIRAAAAQSTLSALARVSLVIGNARYAAAPLESPGNDAKAMANGLRKLGFQVNLKLDAGRNEMLEAIRGFGSELARRASVGLFYYAGHGAQLAWRNYLIPVDVEFGQLEDMRTRAVPLTALLEELRNAQNPMNVIILDACHDNPFGNKVRTVQKGLSQVDAPPGSLLAYATSPGNTVAEGAGATGLYTGNLVRELQVPEERIEDVFKRVRLNVRLKSGGRQVPWESTSLEADFYFLPPRDAKTLSEDERAKQFDEELAIWEQIKEARQPAPLEDYLRKYPSGRFSELAQFQLDRVLARQGEKKIEAVYVPANPFSKGTARASTDYKLGDRYTYRYLNLYTRLETTRRTDVVTAISESEVVFNNGVFVIDLLGNTIKQADGYRFIGLQNYANDYSLGKKWITRYISVAPDAQRYQIEQEFKVVTRESVTVPAGTFDAFKVEHQGRSSGGVYFQGAYWLAPDRSRRSVAREQLRIAGSGNTLTAVRAELVSFRQSG